MREKKVYNVRAINAHTGSREYSRISAVSEKQAWYFFCKRMNSFAYYGWDIRLVAESKQLTLNFE